MNDIMSQNNLTLCHADYFQACWCQLNSSELIQCTYLLRYVKHFSNSSYFCVYHIIRHRIECFDSKYILPKYFISNIQFYLSIIIFLIGLIGNSISIIILLSTKLRHLNVYRNLTILCLLNIFYLILILIRNENNFKQDLRNISINFCRLHVFLTAFIGHLCSWQLVSTSIQRIYVLLSLKPHRTTSWRRTWCIFFIGIVIPLFIFDSQLLFNYGIFKNNHICKEILNDEIRQLRYASKYPNDDIVKYSNNISIKYLTPWFPKSIKTFHKENICFLWNMFDISIYAIIPFIIILICNFIIIIQVCQRRRATIILGGKCHTNRAMIISSHDYLSILLITTNFLYFLMIGPLNTCLIIQSLFQCFQSSKEIFNYLNEYLRLLQNSYHALSFIFYCIIGKKFRSSAKSIYQTIYSKLDRCTKIQLISLCLDRKRHSLSSGQIVSTNSDNKQLNNSIPLNIIKRTTYITFDLEHQTKTFCKCEKV